MKRTIMLILLLLVILCGIFLMGFKVSKSRSFQFFGGLVQKVDTEEKVIALTFDDGPTKKTDEILELLNRLGVKATFFVTGRELEQHIEEGKKIALAGHELGNHTYSHKRMVLKSPAFISEEIKLTDQLIRDTGYQGDIQFRPPFGKKFVLLPYLLKNNNRNTIMWDIEPESLAHIAADSEKIVNHVVENVKPGSIILLHVMYESRKETLNSIEGIVTALTAQGYIFKTVSELLDYQ